MCPGWEWSHGHLALRLRRVYCASQTSVIRNRGASPSRRLPLPPLGSFLALQSWPLVKAFPLVTSDPPRPLPVGGESEPPGHCLHSSGIRETSGQSRPGSGWNFTGDSACSPIPGTLPLRTFPTAPLPQGEGFLPPAPASAEQHEARSLPVRTRVPACVPAQLVSGHRTRWPGRHARR